MSLLLTSGLLMPSVNNVKRLSIVRVSWFSQHFTTKKKTHSWRQAFINGDDGECMCPCQCELLQDYRNFEDAESLVSDWMECVFNKLYIWWWVRGRYKVCVWVRESAIQFQFRVVSKVSETGKSNSKKRNQIESRERIYKTSKRVASMAKMVWALKSLNDIEWCWEFSIDLVYIRRWFMYIVGGEDLLLLLRGPWEFHSIESVFQVVQIVIATLLVLLVKSLTQVASRSFSLMFPIIPLLSLCHPLFLGSQNLFFVTL